EDVLDTWFSSWLWPISVFNGLTQPENEEIKYYYPTNDIVTAPEIMFFWVARMIIAGNEYIGDIPFKNVYYTGIVRDKLGRKMSKQLGNSPDPIELIAKYGADGVRIGILISSPAGNDLPFDSSQCEQGRNFSNKLWNAFRLVDSWTVQEDLPQPESSVRAIEWFEARFNQELENINTLFEKFKISEALMAIYKLVWDDFCSWYLEMIKPGYQHPIDKKTIEATKDFFEKLLKVLQPYTPFVAEELWHLIRERAEGDDIIIAAWPEVGPVDEAILGQNKLAAEVVTNIRNIRKKNNIANKVKLELSIKKNKELDTSFDSVIVKMANLSQLEYTGSKVDNANTFMTDQNEYFVPFGDMIDVEAEREKMTSELEYTKKFLSGVQRKLGNEKFVGGAPDSVVAVERKKESDALSKIAILEEKIASLN
ncbi:MAG: class I tRNA ligase family protein, partial [Crocinitomicaceae bacterium]|nr:class I tRNA ligase family protein [Crocinitomicaceae bacterium]